MQLPAESDMFANFIYFLVALILYTTCEHPGGSEVMPDNALVSALAGAVVFALVCHVSFKRLSARSLPATGALLDTRLEQLLSRLSILALFVFAADLYLFKLKLAFGDFPPFEIFPHP